MRLLRIVLAALPLVPLLPLPADPAAVHGGEITLEVAGDGAAGVTVRATYQDGHPVDDIVLRLVLNGTADGGRSVGPIQLDPANEGRGFYTSGAVLTPGRWQVTVTAPEPTAARAVANVQARTPQTPPPATPASAAPPADGPGTRWLWWVAGAVVLAVAAAGITLIRRR